MAAQFYSGWFLRRAGVRDLARAFIHSWLTCWRGLCRPERPLREDGQVAISVWGTDPRAVNRFPIAVYRKAIAGTSAAGARWFHHGAADPSPGLALLGLGPADKTDFYVAAEPAPSTDRGAFRPALIEWPVGVNRVANDGRRDPLPSGILCTLAACVARMYHAHQKPILR